MDFGLGQYLDMVRLYNYYSLVFESQSFWSGAYIWNVVGTRTKWLPHWISSVMNEGTYTCPRIMMQDRIWVGHWDQSKSMVPINSISLPCHQISIYQMGRTYLVPCFSFYPDASYHCPIYQAFFFLSFLLALQNKAVSISIHHFYFLKMAMRPQ